MGDLVRFRRGAGVRLNYDVALHEVGTVSEIEPRSLTTGPAYRVEVRFKNALIHYTYEEGAMAILPATNLAGAVSSGNVTVTKTSIGQPVLTVNRAQTVNPNTTAIIAGTSIADAASRGNVTVTLENVEGILAAKRGVARNSGHTLTITGSVAAVNRDLASLTFIDATAGSTVISVNATDAAGGVAAQQTITVTVSSQVESTYLETHNFFSATSIWNTRISAAALYEAVSGISSVATGLNSWNPTWDNIAIYYAHTSDPIEQILFNANTWNNVYDGEWQRSGNSLSIEQRIVSSSSSINPYPGNYYSTQKVGLYWNTGGLPSSYDSWQQSAPVYAYVPAGAEPPPSSDGEMVVIQPDGQALEMYSAISLSTGQLVSSMFSFTPALTGMGIGQENGRGASMIENYAGVIRDSDVTSGTISHALAILAPASMLMASFTGPALAFDSNSSNYSGTSPMGTHLALPLSLNLSSLGLQTSLGMELATAAQAYGMYITDQGGTGMTFITQANSQLTALTTYSSGVAHDVAAIFHNAMLVQT